MLASRRVNLSVYGLGPSFVATSYQRMCMPWNCLTNQYSSSLYKSLQRTLQGSHRIRKDVGTNVLSRVKSDWTRGSWWPCKARWTVKSQARHCKKSKQKGNLAQLISTTYMCMIVHVEILNINGVFSEQYLRWQRASLYLSLLCSMTWFECCHTDLGVAYYAHVELRPQLWH